MVAGDLEVVRQEALAQVEAGADILDVNVGAAGVDEVDLLPKAVRLVLETVDVPIASAVSSVRQSRTIRRLSLSIPVMLRHTTFVALRTTSLERRSRRSQT